MTNFFGTIAVRMRALIAGVLLVASLALGQRRRDPLTQPEIDQIRDTSWEPSHRLPLYVQFARARLVKMEEMRSDPKTKDRAKQTHDLLDDFQLLYDELNDNIETYVDRKDDIRKPLKIILDGDTEFQAKLRALKDAAGISQEEASQYEFVLSGAIETVDSSVDDHRKLMAEQEEQAKRKQLNKNPSKGTGVGPE
jgi:uncharacterized coiled-coil DUF342 family protein